MIMYRNCICVCVSSAYRFSPPNRYLFNGAECPGGLKDLVDTSKGNNLKRTVFSESDCLSNPKRSKACD